MATVNPDFRKIAAGYLFPEVARRTAAWQSRNPGTKVLRLGIGNTTEALCPVVTGAMHAQIDRLSDRATYTGYGDEQGNTNLRQALAGYYRSFGIELADDEFFVSDGAKADAANIQEIFGRDNIVAVQDPAYPVYVDSNVAGGRTGLYNVEKGCYDGFVYLPSTVENGFIPEPPTEKVDLIYLCSPNNPTGAVATHEQLKKFVDYANSCGAVIIFDAAYAEYISDSSLPHSIYEVEGAKTCAIEISSFSKFAGFTGVRLGWTVVPHALRCENSEPDELHRLWNRRQCTFFNGASNVSQAGGIAVLSPEGLKECRDLIGYYMGNAKIIREGLTKVGLTVYGGVDSPYVWTRTPNGMGSWEFFDLLLEKCHVVVTPGAGFGPAGEGYVRVSSYGHREDVEAAMESIIKNLTI